MKFFRSKKVVKEIDSNYLIARSPPDLVKELSLSNNIRRIKQHTALNANIFEQLYLPSIHRFIELSQLSPASQAHHHAQDGGMIYHSLSVAEKAIFERKKYTLPLFSTPEKIEEQKYVWTYAVFIAALLHDIGKLITMLDFVTTDGKKHNMYQSMKPGTKYQIEFKKNSYSLHEKVSLSFFTRIVPPVGQGFLSNDLSIFQEIIAFLNKDKANWGSIGEIVRAADMQSTAEALRLSSGERKYHNSHHENVAQRMMTILRIECASSSPKNRPGSSWWINKNHTYVIAKNICEIIKKGFEDAQISDYPRDNSRIFDELMQYGFIETNDENGGAIFNIEVKNEQFNQVFSVVKLETNKLFNITTLPKDFIGEIKEISINKKGNNLAGTESKTNYVEKHEQKTEAVITESKTTGADNNENKMPGTEKENKTNGSVVTENKIPGSDNNEDITTGAEIVPVSVKDQSDSDEITTAFFLWLRNLIIKKDIVVNKNKSPVHIVEHNNNRYVAVVTPKIFIEFGVEILGLQLEDDRGKSIAKCVQHHIHKVKANTPYFNGQVWKTTLRSTTQPNGSKLTLYLFNTNNKYIKEALKIDEFTKETNKRILFK